MIILEKEDKTKKFYVLILRAVKLLIELHYHPFNPRGTRLNHLPEKTEYEDDANRDIRAGARTVLNDIDKFTKKLNNNPISLNWLSIQWSLLILRAIRILIAIHFCCETGEGAKLPSLASPKVKGNVRHPLMSDLTEMIEKLNQEDKDEKKSNVG